MEFIDIAEVKQWDPIEEMWNQIKTSTPWICLAFASGVTIGFFIWFMYVQIFKCLNFLIYGKSPQVSTEGPIQLNMDQIEQIPGRNEFENDGFENHDDNENDVSLHTARSMESDHRSMRTAIGAGPYESSPDPNIRIRSVSNSKITI